VFQQSGQGLRQIGTSGKRAEHDIETERAILVGEKDLLAGLAGKYALQLTGMEFGWVDISRHLGQPGEELSVDGLRPKLDKTDEDVIRSEPFDDVTSIVPSLRWQWDRGDMGNWPGTTGFGGTGRSADACLPGRRNGDGHTVQSDMESFGLIPLVNRVNRHGSLIPIHRIVVEAWIARVQTCSFQLFVDDSLAISICSVPHV